MYRLGVFRCVNFLLPIGESWNREVDRLVASILRVFDGSFPIRVIVLRPFRINLQALIKTKEDDKNIVLHGF